VTDERHEKGGPKSALSLARSTRCAALAPMVHVPLPGRWGAGASDKEAVVSSARAQMSLCLSAHRFALQLSVFGTVGEALNVAPVR
jgi:hypothetical protein